MIKFKVSAKIKVLAIPDKDPLIGDKLIYSLRTGKILRLSNYYVSQLLACELINMPAALIGILVRNELIVPFFEDEAAQIEYKQSFYQQDNEQYDPASHLAFTDQQIVNTAQSLRLI